MTLDTLYLKAADKDALYAALEAANIVARSYDSEDPLNQRPEDLDLETEWQPTGTFSYYSQSGYDLDIIGEIWKPTEELNEEGFPVMQQLEGYHANVRKWEGNFTDEQKAVLPLIIPPDTPYRVWA